MTPEEEQNQPETEEDGVRNEAIRRLRAHRMYLAGAGLLKESAPMPIDPKSDGSLPTSGPPTLEQR
jgi:hypothetical protein